MVRANRQDPRGSNVIPFTPRRRSGKPSILRLSPEYDGMELLYANDQHPDTLFSLKILAWARLEDGTTQALVPWLRDLVTASALSDPLNGRWEGYRLPDSDYLFRDAPEHKVQELDAALRFFGKPGDHSCQEIPDTIGTHAVFSQDEFETLSLMEVVSWRVQGDGTPQAMVADEAAVTQTPVLPGDASLVAAEQQEGFRYFFQHGIANRLKEHDPEALAAIAMLAARY
ncbi:MULTISPECIES: hypothetical protein [Alcanivoracaceae]|jgi:hypothetical protein|uniref:Uncharacterized protein n=1 Tax=Alloalcanivorax xenomutans TaxID=1094342 RepID=A0A9Q3W3R4_9GAMM|nr:MULTISPECIES: hypothetical protein [Alcanivoracaceae]KYZ86445.1 hypothetical protein A3Q32_16835 [Alcanivorax sp. KX64203]MBA4720679.1 hypothetical protein [Alcanivorax sp.]ARB46257.1 hypothetical protein P40_13305 [Alloalcanivorax xenomutans]MCE7507949.1 hypothetical protein [Alloalcanivorax xenomutans]MCE7521655.1 hypothetical protein [Alloalcanivorax xenomutans]|tara:strand:- start:22 stop:705 length:684 start_codon:yes stop_codon:yes gene_type:complete